MGYKVTRQQIYDAAMSMIGVRFLHQGRDRNGVDCVGLLVVLGQEINYPEIFDVEAYRRIPISSVIRDTLAKNCDEIPLEDVGIGDIYFMRHHSLKPRHAAIKISDKKILHANGKVVQLNYISDYPASWFVAGFRVRGLIDE